MLDIVQIDHYIVTHLERQVQLLHFFASACVRGCFWVKRGHRMTNRWAIDLHKDHAQTICNVFHQRRLTITWRRNEQQQAHQVRSLVLADDTNLFSEVITNQGQINLVD